MNGGTDVGSFWIEEINGQVQTTVRKKRKYTTRKKEYNGWGSTSLIWFLDSIGKDTSNEIAQSEVANIISDYVKHKNLLHPTKKKRIVCDEKLHSLFGRKSISRLKISDLLESHIAKNCEESDDDIMFDSDDDENFLATCEKTPKPTSLERKCQPKKPVIQKPRSCFAAINPFNIKLVYLRKSLVEELLNDPESFENKVVGSFIRIRCDPNDYLQKNSHQLLQVTGIKKSSGGDGAIRLKASGFIKDISIHMLSDDNFSEAECEDLHQRVKDGLLKRPMVVDMEQKARVLHEDITKHWLAKELALLENLIERANEKGWRRDTLDEYLQRREKLQSPDEQERLLHEIPQVTADNLELESTTPDVADKKVEKKLQDSWQPTCTKETLVTEVPKTVANGYACKKFQGSDEQEQLLHEVPQVNVDDLESEPTTPDVEDKKEEEKLHDLWQPTCTKASLVTEVPKTVANGFACKVTELFKLQGSDEEECVLHEIPNVIADDRESKSTTPDVPDKEVESNLQEVWQTTNTKTCLVTEVSKAVTDGFACKATKLDIINLAKQESSSPKSILSLSRASEVPPFNMAMNSSMLSRISRDTATEHLWSGVPIQQQPAQHTNTAAYKNGGISQLAESNISKTAQRPLEKQVQPSQIQVIELSDDDEEEGTEESSTIKQVPADQLQSMIQVPADQLQSMIQVPADQLQSMIWHYRDPQGNIQGPFSISHLKRWSDACYFSPDFKVWKSGQSQDQAVLLVDILPRFFPPRGSNLFSFM